MQTKNLEKNVFETIKKFKLVSKNDRVAVAVSGGKDSMVLLHILNKHFNVTPLFVDLGIENFSQESLNIIKNYCKDNSLNLKVLSFKEGFGFSMQEVYKVLPKLKIRACTACGVLRRYILNKNSKQFDKIATGHNLNDESISVLMNIFKANIRANSSLGPKTGILVSKKFVQRIKPLYFCTEKEVLDYAEAHKIQFLKKQCPLRGEPFRLFLSKKLQILESEYYKNTLHYNIINSFLKYIKPKTTSNFKNESINYCQLCGEPSSAKICNSCKLRLKIEKELKRAK